MIASMTLGFSLHDREINTLWIHDHIDHIPHFTRLPSPDYRTVGLERHALAVNLYGEDSPAVAGPHQDNASDLAIPPLFAPTKYPGL